jgi:hypothetical protein
VRPLRRPPPPPVGTALADQVRAALAPPYEALFTLIANHHAGGIPFLVRLRADMLALLDASASSSVPTPALSGASAATKHASGSASAAVAATAPPSPPSSTASTAAPDAALLRVRFMSEHLRRALQPWFCVSLLRLERVTWRSPALVLERIAHHEAVHAVANVADLKQRLGAGRRLFAFFHPNMPDEPLVFVNVALVPRISARIADIIERAPAADAEATATAAVFYSITSAQAGLGYSMLVGLEAMVVTKHGRVCNIIIHGHSKQSIFRPSI